MLNKQLFLVTLILLGACERKTAVQSDTEKGSENRAIDTALASIIDSIAAYGIVEDAYFGEEMIPSTQWNRYEQLKKATTEENLILLTDHENPTVRCYAFRALSTRHSNQCFSVLLNHMNDTALISVSSGCEGWEEKVRDYFINVVTPDHVELGIQKISKKEAYLIDSILGKDSHIDLSLWEHKSQTPN